MSWKYPNYFIPHQFSWTLESVKWEKQFITWIHTLKVVWIIWSTYSNKLLLRRSQGGNCPFHDYLKFSNLNDNCYNPLEEKHFCVICIFTLLVGKENLWCISLNIINNLSPPKCHLSQTSLCKFYFLKNSQETSLLNIWKHVKDRIL